LAIYAELAESSLNVLFHLEICDFIHISEASRQGLLSVKNPDKDEILGAGLIFESDCLS
jgi:hypothetical protein